MEKNEKVCEYYGRCDRQIIMTAQSDAVKEKQLKQCREHPEDCVYNDHTHQYGSHYL